MPINVNMHTADGNRMVSEHGNIPDRKMGINGIKKYRMVSLLIAAIMILAISGCTTQADGLPSVAPDAVRQIEGETKKYDDIAAENIHHVNISGNAGDKFRDGSTGRV